MFVDDARDIGYVMTRGLNDAGIDVETFQDPTAALAHLKPSLNEGIILDIRMPKMSGFELARLIWKQDSQAKTCFFSAFED